jgi:hypothetical protein
MAKSEEVRARGKALHGVGEGSRGIAKACSVDVKTAQAWVRDWEEEGYPKGYLKPHLDQKERESLEEEAKRNGVTRGRLLAKVGELLDAKSIAAVTTQGSISLCPLPTDSKANEGEKAAVAGIEAAVVPDRATQIAAAKMGIDVLGLKKSTLDLTTGGRSLLDEVLDEG